MANILTAAAVSFMYFRHNNLDLKVALLLGSGSILGAQVGALFAAKIPDVGLGGGFGLILILMGIWMWKRGVNREEIIRRFEKVFKTERRVPKNILSISIGFLVGILAGTFGATGGIWFVIISYFVIGLPLHKAIGTSAFAMMLTAISGTAGYAIHGNLSVVGGILVGSGASISGILSAKFANISTEKVLVKAISMVFIGLGIAMLLTKFWL